MDTKDSPKDQRWATPLSIWVDQYEWATCWDQVTYNTELDAAKQSAHRSGSRVRVTS